MAVKFLYNFKNDTATITSSSESGSLIDDNVVDDFVQRKWRTTGDAAEWIKFDLGSPKKVTGIGIFGHNLTSGATVTVEAHASDTWGAPTYSQTFTWNELCLAKILDETYQWWRITFADGSNPDTYIEVGRICMGEYVEPDININAEMKKLYIDPSEKAVTEGRQIYVLEKTTYRTYTFLYDTVDRTLQNQMELLFRTVGNIEPLVFFLDSDNYLEEDTIYCLITTPMRFALSTLGNGNINLTLEELVA